MENTKQSPADVFNEINDILKIQEVVLYDLANNSKDSIQEDLMEVLSILWGTVRLVWYMKKKLDEFYDLTAEKWERLNQE